MEALGRHTFSGAVVACAVGATLGVGGVQGATAMSAMDVGSVAAEACPTVWPALQPGPASPGVDGAVSVLVGGDLAAIGAASGAEGVAVVRGSATVARADGGGYQLGSVSSGSQVKPPAGSDLLTVGGDLNVADGSLLDVGRGVGGDVVTGGTTSGAADLNGGRLDTGYPTAVAAYDRLLAGLADRSAAYAALTPTGTVEVTDDRIVLRGDGVSTLQVFTVDGALAPEPAVPADPADPDAAPLVAEVEPDPQEPPAEAPRVLEVVGVPAGASAVVNLTGPAVDLDVDGLAGPDGTVLDPGVDPAFPELATHLLWNAPEATTFTVGGTAQLPGSLLVPTAGSSTVLEGAGTNGRVQVAGDLVHSAGTLHAYPFLADPEMGCGPGLAHLGTLRLSVELQDEDGVVDAETRWFEGRFSCDVAGEDVTPDGGEWQQRATGARVLSANIPVGAVCRVSERLEVAPGEGYTWLEPTFEPALVTVAKRDPQTITLTNRTKAEPTQKPPPATAPPTLRPTPTPNPDPVPPPPTPTPSAPSTTLPDPTNRPDPIPAATSGPSTAPTAPTAPPDVPSSTGDSRREAGSAAPEVAAPFTLRGGFVWGPLLLLSVLTLLLRLRRPAYLRRR